MKPLTKLAVASRPGTIFKYAGKSLTILRNNTLEMFLIVTDGDKKYRVRYKPGQTILTIDRPFRIIRSP